MSDTPFQRLGGHAAIRGMVEIFYAKILAMPGLARYFHRADVARIKQHHAGIIAATLGAPQAAPDARIRAAHAELGITLDDLEQMLLLLRETLEEAGVDAADVGTLVAEIRRRGQVIVAPD